MSIKAAIKSGTVVKREKITLPECGVEVQVRGLMAGEAHRSGEAKGFKQAAITIALGTEDPETGKFIWNPNSLEDIQELEAMHPVDVAFLVRHINRLSGAGKLEAMLTDQSINGTTTIPSDSDSPAFSAAPSGN